MQEFSPDRRFGDASYDTKGQLRKRVYEQELWRLQVELVKLQRCVSERGLRIVVICEGRDAAGKGGVIKRISEKTSPRIVRTAALGTPSDREQTQWYFQRYVPCLPAAGEMVLFDRSWYNRAGVERVMDFATKEQVAQFMHSCPEFEDMLVSEGIQLVKYLFSVSEPEQERRLQERVADPVKRWKLSPIDIKSRELWAEYSKAKDDMLRYTDTPHAPWYFDDADIKRHGRLNCIAHLLTQNSVQWRGTGRPGSAAPAVGGRHGTTRADAGVVGRTAVLMDGDAPRGRSACQRFTTTGLTSRANSR